ncbi:MAG: Ribosome-associated factor Y [Deltaproteobacteria bacterium ADurb.Bin510]|nr:MAG: Ribosome-associated factor Y [Deltaproteobacteria bacterium ADurb.Bin510]
MQTNITFKNMDATQALKDYVTKRLAKLDRFIERPAEANVVLSVEKIRHKAEVTINSDGHVINAVETTEDMYAAIDLVMDKLERQMKKHKDKVQDHKGASHEGAVEVAEEGGEEVRIIAETDYFVKPMSVEEAALQLGLGRKSFILFQNTATKQMGILYKREDGDLGLVEPRL